MSTKIKPDKAMSPQKIRGNVELFFLYVVLILLAACFVVPFLWLFLQSIKAPHELFKTPVQIFPETVQWNNYTDAINAFPFFKYLKNTLIIVVFNIIGALLSNSFVAYGFSRIRWRYREPLFILVLITMILPFQVVMVPQFIMFQRMGWIGTFAPLIVPAFFGNPFFIFLIRQFYISIPEELSYAAKVDGASEVRIWSSIILPLTKPALTTVAIFSFLNTWNDFVGPLVFLSDNNLYTLSIGVQQIKSNYDPKWNLIMAIGVLMVAPVLVLFFLLQKYFIQGIAMSGVKG